MRDVPGVDEGAVRAVGVAGRHQHAQQEAVEHELAQHHVHAPHLHARLPRLQQRKPAQRSEPHVLDSEEANISFNDTLNTFYYVASDIWLCGVGHMVKNHSDRARGNPLLPLHRIVRK